MWHHFFIRQQIATVTGDSWFMLQMVLSFHLKCPQLQAVQNSDVSEMACLLFWGRRKLQNYRRDAFRSFDFRASFGVSPVTLLERKVQVYKKMFRLPLGFRICIWTLLSKTPTSVSYIPAFKRSHLKSERASLSYLLLHAKNCGRINQA